MMNFPEFLTLDEYAQTLPSAQDVVDWELSLVRSIYIPAG
jgi:hypothetical protein